MTAGSNIFVDFIRMTNAPDDYVGGAVFTGTTVYHNIPVRMQEIPPQQVLVQQGLETLKTFSVVLSRHLTLYERDEMKVIKPVSHPYVDDRFRIVSVAYSDFVDRKPYTRLTLTRSVRAHKEQ